MTYIIIFIFGGLVGFYVDRGYKKYKEYKRLRFSGCYFELDNKIYRISNDAADYICSYIENYGETYRASAFKIMTKTYTGVSDYKTGKLIVNDKEVLNV